MEAITSITTEANIRAVQHAFADFSQGNMEGVANACTSNVNWGSFENPLVPYAGSYYGRKGVLDFFSTLGASVEYLAFEPKHFFADADRVFVKGYHKGKVKSTGKIFGHEFMMEFQLTDGSINSFFAWIDSRDQTMAFAG